MAKRFHLNPERSSDEDGELWIYSYADMMTLLLGFFVLMFSFSTIDERKFSTVSEGLSTTFKGIDDTTTRLRARSSSPQEQDLDAKKALALDMMIRMLGLGNDFEVALPQIEKLYSEQQAAASLEKSIKNRLSKGDGGTSDTVNTLIQNVARHEGSVEVVLPNETLFAAGSYQLRPEAEQKLREVALRIGSIRNLSRIEIIGHSDSTPLGPRNPFPDNFGLSSARAGRVASLLIETGIAPKLLLVRGMADLDPLLPEIDAAGKAIPANQARNRRVHIRVYQNVGDPRE